MIQAEPIVLIPKRILIEAKRCSGCGKYKELCDYDADKKGARGLKSKCKSCRRNYARDYKRRKRENEKVDK